MDVHCPSPLPTCLGELRQLETLGVHFLTWLRWLPFLRGKAAAVQCGSHEICFHLQQTWVKWAESTIA
jgi:hypothetical protein